MDAVVIYICGTILARSLIPHRDYHSTHKGKHTYTPTALMLTCALDIMSATCQWIHEHQYFVGDHMTAAGRYLAEMCDKVLGLNSERHAFATEYQVNPVEAGTLLLKTWPLSMR